MTREGHRNLFRRQALEQQGERLWGDLVLSQPVSFTLLTGFLAMITLVAVLFLLAGDYSRRQEVSGYLAPDLGMVEVGPPKAGVLSALHVRQGSRVERGDPLYEVRVDLTVAGARSLTEELEGELARQRARLRESLALERQGLAARLARLTAAAADVEGEQSRLGQLLGTEGELLDLKARALERARALNRRGLLSGADLDAVHERFLQQQNARGQLQLRLDALAAERRDNQAQREAEAIASRQTEQRLRAERNNRVLAPVGGVVAAVAADLGQRVEPGPGLVSLVPDGSTLEARLLIPSRAVGFLRPGQGVNIRYEAFPYQKFGVQRATLENVSEGVLQGSAQAMAPAREPLYGATARLAAQHIEAYGEAAALKPGMQLSATVVLERRNLLEWLLEPLYSIRGRL